MGSRRSDLIEIGVDPRLASRNSWTIAQVNGKNCRDRQAWGGFTDPDRCDCAGTCKYDQRKENECSHHEREA